MFKFRDKDTLLCCTLIGLRWILNNRNLFPKGTATKLEIQQMIITEFHCDVECKIKQFCEPRTKNSKPLTTSS